MKIGITTRSFQGMTNEQAAQKMAEFGFDSTELCFVQDDSNHWQYNGIGSINELSSARVSEIANVYRKHGINVHCLGVFTNLIEADDSKRQDNLDCFEKYMSWAADCGIGTVATECGFDPSNRGVRADIYETAFLRLVDSFKYLCDKAEKYNVEIALEPCVLDVVPSAKRTRDFIAQVGSNRLKVLLDPANLIANSSEDDMFFYLKDNLSYIHAKDRKVNDTYGRLVGDGDINWPRFFALYQKYGKEVPVIIEYPKADQALMVKERCDAYYEEAKKISI